MISVQSIIWGRGAGGTQKLFLGFGGVAGWSDRAASRVQATELPILPLVFVRGLEDLRETKLVRLLCGAPGPPGPFLIPTWKEHMRVSSTLIMAPALSNSPQ
jgi:hypothetical protein